MSKPLPKRTTDGPTKQNMSEQDGDDIRLKDAGVILKKWAAIRGGQPGIIDDLTHSDHTTKQFELQDDICTDIEVHISFCP